jgi:sulfur-carrier protein adenylyltransferase/sulfurtransferase
MVAEVTVQDLKAQLQTAQPPLVLDVRESWERDIVRLPGTCDIPMAEIAQRLGELPRERPIVVMCRSGGRSLRVSEYLEQRGYRVANLSGGILAWAAEIDPSLPTY